MNTHTVTLHPIALARAAASAQLASIASYQRYFDAANANDDAAYALGELDDIATRAMRRADIRYETAMWHASHAHYRPVDSRYDWTCVVDGRPLGIAAKRQAH